MLEKAMVYVVEKKNIEYNSLFSAIWSSDASPVCTISRRLLRI